MALKLMYITNNPEVALIAENAGVDRIFIDMEYIGKDDRQKGLDTVKSHHTLNDITRIRRVISKAEVMVRCNPIHPDSSEHMSSEEEINGIIENGADIVMLPYFKTTDEVKKFLNLVAGRAKTLLLFETPESIDHLDEILQLDGIDEVFVGLNDLSLGYRRTFMFEVLADGIIDQICQKFKEYAYSYGFGGIAAVGKGMLPAERIIAEHYRLGSTCVILSRSFCDIRTITNLQEVKMIFEEGIEKIRNQEELCANAKKEFFVENRSELQQIVQKICEGK